MLHKVQKRLRRAHRTRTVIEGTASRPRLSVFRSNTHISVQAIDDVRGVTLASAHDGQVAGSKSEKASQVGKQIAEALLAQWVKTCVFDRWGYLYHGRVKALAESARQAGVEF